LEVPAKAGTDSYRLGGEEVPAFEWEHFSKYWRRFPLSREWHALCGWRRFQPSLESQCGHDLAADWL